MNKVYVQIKNGLPINVDIQNAIDGFEYLGYDIITYKFEDIISGKFDRLALMYPFVGSIDAMSKLFKSINKYPTPIDFPTELSSLMNRKIEVMKLKDFMIQFKKDNKSKFIKPVQTKVFDGILISNKTQLSYVLEYPEIDIYVSDPLEIVSEHRVYIRNKQAIYSCNYSGDFRINPDFKYIDTLINSYITQPISYTIDVAILKDGTTTLIEVNDFWAIGSYGLDSINYASMLLDRYNEIIKF